MRRPPVTVVTQVRDDAETVAAFLRLLRPTLRPADQVVVADRGSTDGTQVLLAGHADRVRWLRLPRGWDAATALRVAADAVTTPLAVLVDTETMPYTPWLDRLAAPLVDPAVEAVVPMTLVGPAAQRYPLSTPLTADPDAVRRLSARVMGKTGAARPAQAVDAFAVAVRQERLGLGWTGRPADLVGPGTVVASNAFLFRLVPPEAEPLSARPAVSLVVPVGDDLAACLARLAEAAPAYEDTVLEVVLVDQGNGLAAQVAAALSGAAVRVVRGSGQAGDVAVASRVADGHEIVVLA